jgi:hypothetical protein
MTHDDRNSIISGGLIADLNRSLDEVTAEIATRTWRTTSDPETTKRNRRFIAAKAATLSEAAGIARSGARQLTLARTRILEEVTKAEAAGFVVQEDFSIEDPKSSGTRVSGARDYARTIQAAVADFNDLDERVSLRLRSAANALGDLRNN